MTTTSTPPPDAAFARYLRTNRDFCAPTVRAAIAALDLPAGARVLDIGTGAGGALAPLLAAAGPGGTVHAVDRHAGVAALAAADAPPGVIVHTGDAVAHAAAQRNAGQPYDAIWASDVLWPGNFSSPAAAAAELLGTLTPGGTLALLVSGYYQATFLPGHAALELRVRLASLRRWNLPTEGPDQHDRLPAWLVAAGAVDTTVQVFPRVGRPDEPAVRAYLEGTVWPELRESAATHGHEVGLTDAELATLTALTDPTDPRHAPDEAGHYVVQPALLVTGRRPG